MMTNVRRLALSLIVTLVAMICTSNALHANGGFQLANANSNRCLTIAGGVLADNNRPIVQFDCDSDLSRQWILNSLGNSTYKIQNAKTNKCLTIAGGTSTDNNVTAVQFTCDNDPSRKWKMIPSAAGFQIKNVATGKCLTVAGGAVFDNVEAVQFDCDSDQSRGWIIKGAPPPPPTPPSPPGNTRQISQWTAWTGGPSVQYRYRIAWNTDDSRTVDVYFQLRSFRQDPWQGMAVVRNCLAPSDDHSRLISVRPGQTLTLPPLKAPNCGTATNPTVQAWAGEYGEL